MKYGMEFSYLYNFLSKSGKMERSILHAYTTMAVRDTGIIRG